MTNHANIDDWAEEFMSPWEYGYRYELVADHAVVRFSLYRVNPAEPKIGFNVIVSSAPRGYGADEESWKRVLISACVVDVQAVDAFFGAWQNVVGAGLKSGKTHYIARVI